MRVEIEYIKAQGVENPSLVPSVKVVELGDTLIAAWDDIKEMGGVMLDDDTFIPKTAIIALRKSDWKGRI